VFGGGSFGTAIGCALARQKPDLVVTLLLRDPRVCADINTLHVNTRYLKARAAAKPRPVQQNPKRWGRHCMHGRARRARRHA